MYFHVLYELWIFLRQQKEPSLTDCLKLTGKVLLHFMLHHVALVQLV